MGSAGTIAVGIIVGLIASCIQSLGLTIQRKSHVLNNALPEEQQRLEYRRPLWLLGFAVFLSSNIVGSFVQIASLPVVILAPLGAVSLLWNAFFARILLGDGTSPWVIAGTLLIAGGAVLIGVFGIVPEPTHSLEDLLALFSRPTFIVYFSLLGFAMAVVLAITHIAEFSYTRHLRRMRAAGPLSPVLAPSAGPSLGSSERTPLLKRPSSSSSSAASIASTVVLTSRPSRVPLALALSYASVSGIVSGMCLIFAKSGVELLLLTFGGANQFWRWQAWLLLLGLVVFALLQLWYLHKALTLADPTIVCPLAFCFYNLSSIVNGLVYYDQFALLSTRNLLLVVLGMVVLLAGVWAVSLQSIAVGPPDGADSDGACSDSDGETSALAPLDDAEAGAGVQRRRPAAPDLVLPLGGAARPPTSPPRRRHTLSPELALGSPPPAPGFSIGLSPVSPGFSLSRQGRRRASGPARGRSGSEDAGLGSVRRTASEGLSGLPVSRVDESPGEGAGVGGGVGGAGGGGEGVGGAEPDELEALLPIVPVPVSRGRDPWRWLKGLAGRKE